jgi:hypothetical protein
MPAMRRLGLWALVLPLMLAGTEVAHALAYRIVYPVASVRWHALAESGHGYLGYAPLVAGIGVAIVVAGVASTALDAIRRRPVRQLPAWAFGSLPLVGVTVQEFTERLIETRTLPWWMVEQPTFRVGLALQLPFALAAYVAARLLLRVGRAIGDAVARRLRRPAPVRAAQAHAPSATRFVPRAPFAGGWSVRGPPLVTG